MSIKKIDTNNCHDAYHHKMIKLKIKYLQFFVFFVVVLTVIDLLTKYFVFTMENDMIYVLPILNMVKAKNFGITFGLFDDRGFLVRYGIVIFDIFVIGLLLYNITKKNFYRRPRIFILSILSIVSGAMGNLFDRLFYGYVRDFIDFHIFNYHWYIFNVADIYICVGTVFLIICELFFREKSK